MRFEKHKQTYLKIRRKKNPQGDKFFKIRKRIHKYYSNNLFIIKNKVRTLKLFDSRSRMTKSIFLSQKMHLDFRLIFYGSKATTFWHVSVETRLHLTIFHFQNSSYFEQISRFFSIWMETLNSCWISQWICDRLNKRMQRYWISTHVISRIFIAHGWTR